jgi:hypothetical protein
MSDFDIIQDVSYVQGLQAWQETVKKPAKLRISSHFNFYWHKVPCSSTGSIRLSDGERL